MGLTLADLQPWAPVIAAFVTVSGVNLAVLLGFALARRNEAAKLRARGDAADVTSRVAGVEEASKVVGKAVAEVEVLDQLKQVRDTLGRVDLRIKGLATSMDWAHKQGVESFTAWEDAVVGYLKETETFPLVLAFPPLMDASPAVTGTARTQERT